MDLDISSLSHYASRTKFPRLAWQHIVTVCVDIKVNSDEKGLSSCCDRLPDMTHVIFQDINIRGTAKRVEYVSSWRKRHLNCTQMTALETRGLYA